jgi:hypothetical protein
MNAVTPIRMLITTPVFFATPLKKLRVEENAGTGRTYFLKGAAIVAVAVPSEGRA